MKYKKIMLLLLAAVLILLPFSACSGQKQTSSAKTESSTASVQTGNSKKINIVATIFPPYDWVRQILGENADNAELTMLLDNGVDLHSYQPTVQDIAAISACDVFIYVGGESDSWVENALATASNPNRVVINLLETLGDRVKEEEIVEGMEHEHEQEEIDPETIKDRPLSDWAGDWTTIEQALKNGDLNHEITTQAEANGVTFDTQKEAQAKKWKSDYESLQITESRITFGNASAAYRYTGYQLVETEHGSAVWYGFEAETAADEIPQFVAFSDHGTGGEAAEAEEGAAHFHIRYGNESFQALTAMEDWAPTYFAASATGAEIAEAMGGHSHSEEQETDEHVWLSLKNAQVICTHIAKALGKADPQNAEIYKTNAAAYDEKLAALDKQYQEAVNSGKTKTLLFGDRFPFRYLVDDYQLNYFAAFSGCSAETEASFETIVFLANEVDTLNLKNIMVIETSNQSIANTIAQNTANKNQNILVLNSMQSVTAAEISGATTYLSIMESNLEVLKQALS